MGSQDPDLCHLCVLVDQNCFTPRRKYMRSAQRQFPLCNSAPPVNCPTMNRRLVHKDKTVKKMSTLKKCWKPLRKYCKMAKDCPEYISLVVKVSTLLLSKEIIIFGRNCHYFHYRPYCHYFQYCHYCYYYHYCHYRLYCQYCR